MLGLNISLTIELMHMLTESDEKARENAAAGSFVIPRADGPRGDAQGPGAVESGVLSSW